MKVYLAQKFEISGTPIQGPLPDNISTISDVIGIILSFLYPLAGILLFFMLVWGGYSFLMSGGQPEKIKSARGYKKLRMIPMTSEIVEILSGSGPCIGVPDISNF